jgi:hypothetical protein
MAGVTPVFSHGITNVRAITFFFFNPFNGSNLPVEEDQGALHNLHIFAVDRIRTGLINGD